MTFLILIAVITFLLVVAEHYLPWWRKPLSVLEEIAMILLTVIIPYSFIIGLFQTWTRLNAIAMLWALIGIAAVARLICCLIDSGIAARARAAEAVEREQMLLAELKCDKND